MTEPMPCPECGHRPTFMRLFGQYSTLAVVCIDANKTHKIHIEDSGALTFEQLVALWNERCRKVLDKRLKCYMCEKAIHPEERRDSIGATLCSECYEHHRE